MDAECRMCLVVPRLVVLQDGSHAVEKTTSTIHPSTSNTRTSTLELAIKMIVRRMSFQNATVCGEYDEYDGANGYSHEYDEFTPMICLEMVIKTIMNLTVCN
jgi:hypothetical protein